MDCPGDEQFVSEPITPDRATGDVSAMARGEPGLASGFIWRDQHYRIVALLDKWKSSGKGKGGGVYLRRHWYRVLTEPSAEVTLYCLRQAQSTRRSKSRWFLYSIRRKEQT